MAYDLEFCFEELKLLASPAQPDKAIAYASGQCEITIEGEGYVINGVFATNVAGDGLVYIHNDHNLRPLLEASIRAQFDGHIRDQIAEHLEEAA